MITPDEPPMGVERMAKIQVAKRYLDSLFSGNNEHFILVVAEHIGGTPNGGEKHAFDLTTDMDDGFLKSTLKHVNLSLKAMSRNKPLPWGRKGGEPL